ncbi:hypothetical protein [Tetragenococcus koreensis]|uniref:hypothetical protein n=1 Tax=Tetragenococcus koreensis TaxID=290335 RepID=UPI001F3F2735|nr:hypothetical protein [Tetragenococcus koreensis]MCF1632927.1 hypothetical protein [Tetragenococcus koreensis]
MKREINYGLIKIGFTNGESVDYFSTKKQYEEISDILCEQKLKYKWIKTKDDFNLNDGFRLTIKLENVCFLTFSEVEE